ncbi:MAG: hypothetical protein L6R42_001982 [Xanthoria sp. 1 TBL-2021]|nr:MAG: hypothetical protein L6R42_001982 [Xanthoria sp. 1 TBL-2021]
MGYKRDQNYDGDTFRTPSTGPADVPSELPPPYTEEEQSTSKVVPALPPRRSAAIASLSDERRRKLLLIYVHGFTGNETSFQRFPTDVHDLASRQLVDTYTVQSIVYPKYKSRKKIDFARDEFSCWLREHESDRTDVILLGHSMGGLLAAEVALLPLNNFSAIPLRHRILGTVNLDAPFLGIHPGIVASGISSLFRKAPDQAGEAVASSQEPLMTPSSSVDVPRSSSPSAAQVGDTSRPDTSASSLNVASSIRSLSLESQDNPSGAPEATDSKQSKLSRAIYFINKHSDGLTKATKSYLTSHIEFGGCLADYKGLLNRYSGIRALEDNPRSRVRFINYYTASTGRAKMLKPPDYVDDGTQPLKPEDRRPSADRDTRDPNLSESFDTKLQQLNPRASTDRDDGTAVDSYVISSEDISDNEPSDLSEEDKTEVPTQSFIDITNPPTREPPHIPSSLTPTVTKPKTTDSSDLLSADFLPSLPDHPSKPPPFDSSMYPDKDALKIASRDHERALKTYNLLLKDRDNAIKDRRKLLDKRRKAAEKQKQDEERKASKSKAKLNEKATAPMAGNDDNGAGMESATTATSEPQPIPETSSPSSPPPPIPKPTSTTPAKPSQPPKQHKALKYRPFCLLPHQPDPTWIRVVMRDTDEIEAHCGLFAREGEHYEGFVTAVVERIGTWIEEASIGNRAVS